MARSLRLSLVVVCLAAMASGVGAWAAQDEHIPLSLAIAVPVEHGKRSIALDRPEAHFHVVLTNISTHNVSLWQGEGPEGYSSLSFEVTDAEGNTWAVRKKERQWKRTPLPSAATLDPNGHLVIDVTFDPEIWENPPLPDEGKSVTVSIRAIYEIPESDDAAKNGVWTGRVVSEKKEYAISR
ncbi:MAG: hypothetical protein JXA57_14520 [Armatimonadetes bacterium]|nr:hypothetical protein [Armatimonadota bacterium]